MSTEDRLPINDVVILHDSNGRPYYEAVQHLMGEDNSPIYLVSSVICFFLRGLKQKKPLRPLFSQCWMNFKFRIFMPFVKEKTIIMGMAPYDLRFFFYSLLAFRNNLIFHTSWPFWWSERVPKRFGCLCPLLAWSYSWVLNHFPIKVVCVTDTVREHLITKLRIEQCFTVPHALRTDLYRPAGQNFHGPLRLLYVGRLVSEKGIDLLLALAKDLDPQRFELHVVGGGPLASNVKQAADKLSVLTFHGLIHDKSKLAALMGSCHILLLPSRRVAGWEELFGIVVIEAMSCGLVVLATDHIGPASILHHGVDGILLPDGVSVEQFGEQIERLATDREQLQQMAQQARQQALQYDLAKVGECWRNVITL